MLFATTLPIPCGQRVFPCEPFGGVFRVVFFRNRLVRLAGRLAVLFRHCSRDWPALGNCDSLDFQIAPIPENTKCAIGGGDCSLLLAVGT